MKEKQSLKEFIKHNKILFIIALAALLCIVIGFTYSLYEITLPGVQLQKIETGDLIFTYNEKSSGISLSGNSLLSDDEGKALNNYFDFDIALNSSATNSADYYIYLVEDETSTLANNCVKVYLTDNNDTQIVAPTSISMLDNYSGKNYLKLLYNSNISTNNTTTTKKFRLRAWIDKNTEINYNQTDNEGTHVITVDSLIYKFKVNVSSTLDVNVNFDRSGASLPQLASNMIPVYYDGTDWKKADSNNYDSANQWYSYESSGDKKGMWANAVTYDHTKAYDSSSSSNNGILENGAAYTKEGVTFDGTNDYINAGSANYAFGTTLTLGARVKFDSNSTVSYQQIINNDDNLGNGFNIAFNKLTQKFYFVVIGVGRVDSSTTSALGVWHNVVGTYDGSSLKMYVDGVLTGTTSVSGTVKTSTTNIIIGSHRTNFSYVLDGVISDVLVTKSVLDATTISNYYGENFNYQTNSNTVFYYNLRDYNSRDNGAIIPMDMINTMWVWIPRFNAVTPSNYNGGTQEAPGAIDVTFVDKTKTAIDAFTFGTQSLSGFWYGKFETSHSSLSSSTTNNNLGCTTETCSNANGLLIKPNVASLRYNDISNFFYASRSMEQVNNSFGFVSSEVDTHMSKNNEWGAVAYLTQSIYGRCTSTTSCTEVAINDNSSYITGGNDYKTNINQSTTGTIYGIYDMSGGTYEYVMGNYNSTIGSSGFSSMPESKYYNLYTGSSYTGHALNETSGWYSDGVYFVNSSYPWFLRGGSVNDGAGAGIFYFYNSSGNANSTRSSRLVVVK